MSIYYLSIFITISYAIEAISGFGGIVIALALGASFYTIPEILNIALPLNLFLSFILMIRNHRLIDKALLLKLIFPFMFIGTFLGFILSSYIKSDFLKIYFGIFLLILSGLKIIGIYFFKTESRLPLYLARPLIILSGIIHGIYGSGGPLLVYSISSSGLDKGRFRASLSCLWFVINFFLCTGYIVSGSLNASNAVYLFHMLPTVFIGLFIGNYLHKKINQESFTKMIYFMLSFISFFLIF